MGSIRNMQRCCNTRTGKCMQYPPLPFHSDCPWPSFPPEGGLNLFDLCSIYIYNVYRLKRDVLLTSVGTYVLVGSDGFYKDHAEML